MPASKHFSGVGRTLGARFATFEHSNSPFLPEYDDPNFCSAVRMLPKVDHSIKDVYIRIM